MEANVLLSRVHRRPAAARKGFSLVEVCLALGIVAFALVPLVGLLTVGLDSYRNANLRGRSAQVVSKIASAIRLGNGTGGNGYAAAAPFASGPNAITWTVQDTATSTELPAIYFDENGEITTLVSSGAGWNPPQMVAKVILTPPTTKFDAGKALIAVAWPANRAPTYSSGAGITFANPQGHDESTISFVPNSP